MCFERKLDEINFFSCKQFSETVENIRHFKFLSNFSRENKEIQ